MFFLRFLGGEGKEGRQAGRKEGREKGRMEGGRLEGSKQGRKEAVASVVSCRLAKLCCRWPCKALLPALAVL